ncbi:Methionine aminopeptidase [Minicystis rosea]|nr:Methionine aminopeptidase [Minicystis rosea]
MASGRSSLFGSGWLARLFGIEETAPPDTKAPAGATSADDGALPSISVDDVRRLAMEVGSQKPERILEESRRIAPILSEVMRDVGRSVVAGDTTRDVADRLVKEAFRHDLLPAMLGYNAFPAMAATSVNEEVLHGIPSHRALKNGDLLKLQFGVVSGAAFAAQGWTFPIGRASAADNVLLSVGPRALRKAIDAVAPGCRTGDIGAAIQAEAEGAGLAVVRAYTGYGMGKLMIQAPQLQGTGTRGRGPRIHEGAILHLHVILKHGTYDVVIREDRWTAAAEDEKRGALFTAMVEVTADGHRLLSALLDA